MTSFNIIENTVNNSSFSSKDILLAGGLLGSFAYLSFCVPDKVIVVRPKDKDKHERLKSKGNPNPKGDNSLKTEPKIVHHKPTGSFDRMSTEPAPLNDQEQMSTSVVINTEIGDEERDLSTFPRHKGYAKSHIHIPQSKNSHKVSFDPQMISSQDNKPHMSESVSPGSKKHSNYAFFNDSSANGTKSMNNSFLGLRSTTEKSKSSFHEESSHHGMISSEKINNNNNHLFKNSSEHNVLHNKIAENGSNSNISTPNNNNEKKSCFMGLARFKSAMAAKNPFFLSGMGFSAVSLRDSSSMFQSARSLKSLKLATNVKESQTLYHLPIEKPLLSKDDLSFIEKMMTLRNEENVKILNSKNEKEVVKRKAMDVHVEGQEWEVSEYNSKDFNLDNVYKNFLIEQKPRIILPIKSSSDNFDLPSVSEKDNDDTATLKRKSNFLKTPLTSKGGSKKHSNFSTLTNEDIVEFLTNSYYEKGSENSLENGHEDEMLRLHEIMKNCRKFDEIQTFNLGVLFQEEMTSSSMNVAPPLISSVVENVKLNVCVKFSDTPEKETFAIGKLSFTLSQSNLILLANQPLILDFAGKRLVQVIMNHKTNDKFPVNWKNNKLFIPNESLTLGENSLTFLTGADFHLIPTPLLINDFYLIMPSFKNYEKNMDLQMTLLYPKSMNFLSSLSEIYEYNFDDFEIDPDLGLEHYHLTKIRGKETLKNHALLLGQYDPILLNEAFGFYCKSGNKKLFFKKAMGLSDVLRLAEAYFNNYLKSLEPLKNNLKFVFVEEQKTALKVFRGVVLLKTSFMLREDKFAELLFILLKLLLKEIFVSNEINLKSEYSWMFHGLSGFLILHFLEKQLSSSFEVPVNEILLLMIQGKVRAIEQNLLKTGIHKLNDTSLDRFQTDDSLCIYKSIYFFKQLAAYIGKKAIHQVLMEMDYKSFSVKLFLKNLEPFLRENELVYFKKWLGVWLCGMGLQEIEFEIYINPHRPLFLNELLILQRPLNWGQGSNELNYHFLAFSLINNAGVSQFTLDIVIPNTSESCIVDKIRGKYVPKALIMDPDDNGYFIYKFDLKTKAFLYRNIHKIGEMKMRMNCYCAFYLETLIGRFNALDFFDMAVKGMENESDFSILRFLHKGCKRIYKTLGTEEMRVRLFKFLVLFWESKRFVKKDEFFFKNAVFYCKTDAEFENLEQILEKMEKSISYVPLIVKLLWKKTFYYHINEIPIIESAEFMNKNQIYLDKINTQFDSEIIHQLKTLYNQMLDYLSLGLKVCYEKLLFLISENSIKTNYFDFQTFILASQILEEYIYQIKGTENANPNENNIEQTKFIEYIRNNEENDDREIWVTMKFLITFIGSNKICEKINEKGILKKILAQKSEIQELLKNSLSVLRLN